MSASTKLTKRQQSLIESKAKKPCRRLTFESFCEAKAEELSNLYEMCLDGLGLDEKKRSFEEFCGWAFDQATGIEIVSDSDDEEEGEQSESEEIESEETETETETEELDSDALESDDPSELQEESVDEEDENDENDEEEEEIEEESAVENKE